MKQKRGVRIQKSTYGCGSEYVAGYIPEEIWEYIIKFPIKFYFFAPHFKKQNIHVPSEAKETA